MRRFRSGSNSDRNTNSRDRSRLFVVAKNFGILATAPSYAFAGAALAVATALRRALRRAL